MLHHNSLGGVSLQNTWLTVGVFDGVHRGHQEILRKLTAGAHASGAPAVVLTFDPHPAFVLSGREIKCLTTADERVELFGKFGVDVVITERFTRELSTVTAYDFMSRLSPQLGLRRLLIGYDFALGRGREGNAARLAELGDQRQRTGLSDEEVREADDLVQRHDRVMVVRAEAAALPARNKNSESNAMSDQFSNSQVIRKPAVSAKGGIVAAQSRKAAEVGAEVLAAGGDCVDAVIATTFALGVVEPWMSAAGGGSAMVLYRAKENRVEVIDYGMRAPDGLRLEDYPLTGGAASDLFPWARVKDDRNLHGPGSIAVPGVVAGMEEAHRRHAKMPWKDLLAPSVKLAGEGLLVDWWTVPGPHNWSGTDNRTIEETPLGGIPEMVKWSVSVMRTPHGWVGRVDNHLKKTTVHVPVEPNIPAELAQKVAALLPAGTEDDWENRDWYDDLEDDELDLEDPYGDDQDDEYETDDDQTKSDNLFARIYHHVWR